MNRFPLVVAAAFFLSSCDDKEVPLPQIDFDSALENYIYVNGTMPAGGCVEVPKSESDTPRTTSEQIDGTYHRSGSVQQNPLIVYSNDNPDVLSMADIEFLPPFPFTVSAVEVQPVDDCGPAEPLSVSGLASWIVTFPLSESEACVAPLAELEQSTDDACDQGRRSRNGKTESQTEFS